MLTAASQGFREQPQMHGPTNGPGLSFWVLNHINVMSMRETCGEEFEIGDGKVEFENHKYYIIHISVQ